MNIWKKFDENYFKGTKELLSMKLPGDFPIILDYLNPEQTDKILDFGCGFGRVAAAISKYGSRVIGLDISDYAINQAKKLYPKGNLEFRCIDSGEFDYKHEFDKIVCYHVLEHLSQNDSKIILQNLYDALKKDGIIVIGVPLEENNILRTGIRLLATRRLKRDPTHLRSFSLYLIKKEIEESGFKILNLYPYSYHPLIKIAGIPIAGKKLLTCVVIKAKKT